MNRSILSELKVENTLFILSIFNYTNEIYIKLDQIGIFITTISYHQSIQSHQQSRYDHTYLNSITNHYSIEIMNNQMEEDQESIDDLISYQLNRKTIRYHTINASRSQNSYHNTSFNWKG